MLSRPMPATPADAQGAIDPANRDASCRIVWEWMWERRGRQGRIEKGRTSELECCNVYLAMARTCTQSTIDITLF